MSGLLSKKSRKTQVAGINSPWNFPCVKEAAALCAPWLANATISYAVESQFSIPFHFNFSLTLPLFNLEIWIIRGKWLYCVFINKSRWLKRLIRRDFFDKKLELPISVNLCLILIGKSNKKRENENLNEIGAKLKKGLKFVKISFNHENCLEEKKNSSSSCPRSMIKNDKRNPFSVQRKRNMMFFHANYVNLNFRRFSSLFIIFIEFAAL